MKRFAALVLAFVMALSVCACSKTEPTSLPDNTSDPGVTSDQEVVQGEDVDDSGFTDEFMQNMLSYIESVAQEKANECTDLGYFGAELEPKMSEYNREGIVIKYETRNPDSVWYDYRLSVDKFDSVENEYFHLVTSPMASDKDFITYSDDDCYVVYKPCTSNQKAKIDFLFYNDAYAVSFSLTYVRVEDVDEANTFMETEGVALVNEILTEYGLGGWFTLTQEAIGVN